MTALDLFLSAPREAPAFYYFDTCLSYGDIDLLSDRLAGWLSRKGVGRGDRVAIVLQNVPQFAIATVAAWKLGAIVVSLNPMYRAPELAKLFADCTPKAVLCHDDQWETVSSAAAGMIEPDLVLWTGGHEFQTRNDARVLPPPGKAPAEQAMAKATRASAAGAFARDPRSRRHRTAALHVRNDRRAERRHADPPQSRRQCAHQP